MLYYGCTRDELFSKLKPISKKLDNKITECCFEHQYLFKQRSNKKALVYCTHCNKEYEYELLSNEKPLKHNDTVRCLKCHKRVIVKDAGRGKKHLYDRGYAVVFQKLHNDIIVMRTFALLRNYQTDYKDVKTLYSEHYRIFLKPGEVHSFKRTSNPNSGYFIWDFDYFYLTEEGEKKCCYWKEMKNPPQTVRYPTGFYFGSPYYQYDLIEPFYFNTEIIEKSKYFKYSCFEDYRTFTDTFYEQYYYQTRIIHKYLLFYCKHPELTEHLIKQGYANVLIHYFDEGFIPNLNMQAKTVKEFFRFTNKAEERIVKKIVSTIDTRDARYISAYFELKKYGIPISEARIRWAYSNDLFNIKIIIKQNKIKRSAAELVDYLIKKDAQLSDYKDYLNCLHNLKVEVNQKQLFPRNFWREHDRLTLLKKDGDYVKEPSKEFRTLRLPYLQYVFSFVNDLYIVRPFETPTEMVLEGEHQHICVGGASYLKKQFTGEGIICYLRKASEPEKSYLTIELTNKLQLVQARGKFNASCTDEEREFIREWIKQAKIKNKRYVQEVN